MTQVNIFLFFLVSFILACSLTSAFSNLYEEVLVTVGQIQNATIFASSGQVEISKVYYIDTSSISPDSTQLVTYKVKNLPGGADVDISFMAIDKNSHVTILGTTAVPIFENRQQNVDYLNALATLTTDLSANKKKMEKLQWERKRLEGRLEVIEKLSTSSTSKVADNSYPSISALLTSIDEESIKTVDKLYEVSQTIIDTNTTISNIEQAISSLTGNGIYSYQGKRIVFPERIYSLEYQIHTKTFKSSSASQWAIGLSYMTASASWSNTYNLKVNSIEYAPGSSAKKHTLSIESYASVTQQTSEDWQNVRLTLMTSQPQMIENPPAISRIGIGYQGFYQQAQFVENARSGVYNKKMMMASSRAKAMDGYAGGQAESDMAVSASSSAIQPMAFAAVSQEIDVDASGDMTASYKFIIPEPVNIKSQLLESQNNFDPRFGATSSTGNYRVLLDTQSFDVMVFSYCIPSANGKTYLRAWGKYPVTRVSADQQSSRNIPLLPSDQAKVFVQEAYVGTKQSGMVLPGERIIVDLGVDPNLQVSSFKALSTNSGKADDKSTWFTVDKKEYNVRTKEAIIKAKNIETQGLKLMILAENLPKSAEQEITVKILSPAKFTSIVSLANGQDLKFSDDESLVEFLLDRMTKMMATVKIDDLIKLDATIVFNEITNTILWVKILSPGEEYSSSLKYQIIWPREKSITTF